jgi:TetR/AcrR family transcriptional regulator
MKQSNIDPKERIFAAAEAEFMVRGYDGSRMQAIADRAKINKAMLHYHFGSKDALFAQVFKEKSKLLFPKLEASLRQQSDFISFVCSFVDLYVGHLIENPFLPTYLFQVSAHHVELLEQVKLDLPKKLIRAFEAAVKNNTVRPHDPQQFVISLLGMCVMPFAAKNLIKNAMGLSEEEFLVFLQGRAEELKRYLVLLLTPQLDEEEAN